MKHWLVLRLLILTVEVYKYALSHSAIPLHSFVFRGCLCKAPFSIHLNRCLSREIYKFSLCLSPRFSRFLFLFSVCFLNECLYGSPHSPHQRWQSERKGIGENRNGSERYSVPFRVGLSWRAHALCVAGLPGAFGFVVTFVNSPTIRRIYLTLPPTLLLPAQPATEHTAPARSHLPLSELCYSFSLQITSLFLDYISIINFYFLLNITIRHTALF